MDYFKINDDLTATIRDNTLQIKSVQRSYHTVEKTHSELLELRQRVQSSQAQTINIGNNWWGKVSIPHEHLLKMLNWAITELN